MKQVHQPESPENWDFDIVAVHGLSELPRETWVHTSHAKGQVDKLKMEADAYALSPRGRSSSAERSQTRSSVVDLKESPKLAKPEGNTPASGLLGESPSAPALSGGGNTDSKVALSGTTKTSSLKKSKQAGVTEPKRKDSLTAPSLDQRKGKRAEHVHEVNWLQDSSMLPKAFPNARIFQYGYEWESDRANITLDDICQSAGNNLLTELVNIRPKDTEFPPKPLLFIGHSYGGIVIEYALNTASKTTGDKKQKGIQQEGSALLPPDLISSYKDLILSTVGVIFLATPFKFNPDLKSRWERLGIILPDDSDNASSNANEHNKQEEPTETRDSSPKTVNIQLINSEFVKLVKKEGFRVSCFYEFLPSKDSTLGKVVQCPPSTD